MQVAFIGLGRMGNGLASQALGHGISVVGFTKGQVSEDLIKQGLVQVDQLEDLLQMTTTPRKIFLYIPAGPAVEEIVHFFRDHLEKGDIVVDGGNSYWGDSIRRYHSLKEKGIRFLDMGTSGGIEGAWHGGSFMVGGDRDAYEEIVPILKTISIEDGFAYIGPAGSGHLVKLIHNGIEFGMLQAIGEGMALLEKYKEHLPIDMESVFKTYRHGSVIRSWLIDLMYEQYRDQDIMSVPSYIEDTGEVNWLLNDAIHLEVPIPVISQSVMELFRSRDKEAIDHRSVALMRHGFGHHAFGPSAGPREERLSGRLNAEFPENLS